MHTPYSFQRHTYVGTAGALTQTALVKRKSQEENSPDSSYALKQCNILQQHSQMFKHALCVGASSVNITIVKGYRVDLVMFCYLVRHERHELIYTSN